MEKEVKGSSGPVKTLESIPEATGRWQAHFTENGLGAGAEKRCPGPLGRQEWPRPVSQGLGSVTEQGSSRWDLGVAKALTVGSKAGHGSWDQIAKDQIAKGWE